MGGDIGSPVWLSMCITVPSPPLATQTEASSTTRPSEPTPTSIGWPGKPDDVSMRWMVLSPLLATQSPAGPAATAYGLLPTWIVSTTWSASMLIRETVPSAKFVTHTSSPVTARARGS